MAPKAGPAGPVAVGRARAPASAANLGPGFDTLAVALSLYVEVDAAPAGALRITSAGQGAALPAGASHICAVVARQVVGHDRFAFTVRSEVPVARGLGSSAALAVATAAAVAACTSQEPGAAAGELGAARQAAGELGAARQAAFEVAAAFDGHPDNAAACAFGGLTASATIGGVPTARRMSLDPGLAFVVAVPDVTLATADARAVLPTLVAHEDAAFNLQRMALLLAGLADSTALVPEATGDRLHQQQRAALFAESTELLAGLVACGALAACWSGAGPSLLAICRAPEAAGIARGAAELMERLSVPGRAIALEADTAGLVLS
ncbi:MAG: homoserine kinase [Acidimicrobiales bacterium]